VNAETIFLDEISRVKRRVFSRLVCRLLLWACAFFLGSYTLFAIILKAHIYGGNHYGLWVLALGAISLIAATGVAIFESKAFQSFLIEIDARLQLGESISTAFEYQQAGHQSVFLDLLMQDATAKLRRLSPREIFPAGFSRLHFFLIVAVIAAMAYYFGFYSNPDFKPVLVDQLKIEKALKLVRDFADRHPAVGDSKAERQHPVIKRNIEQLRKTLNQPAITREHLFTLLNRHLKEVQAEQMRQVAELGARLDDAQIRKMPIQDPLDLQNFNAGQLEKLKKLLNQALNNRIPDGIQDDVESLQELFSLEKLLTRVIEEFHEGYSGPQEQADSERYQTPVSSSPEALSKRNDDSLQSEDSGRNPSNPENGSADTSEHTRSGDSHSDGFGVPGERGLSHGTSPRAGRARSDGREKSGSEIEKATGPKIQEKWTPAQVKQYLVRIRTLTAAGESYIKEEEVIRSYQQEIEGVLQKEDIPLNYRDYIRNYFLSIGLEPGETAR
jgi:hypothetical protein